VSRTATVRDANNKNMKRNDVASNSSSVKVLLPNVNQMPKENLVGCFRRDFLPSPNMLSESGFSSGSRSPMGLVCTRDLAGSTLIVGPGDDSYSSSNSDWLGTFGPSLRIGILIPCCAKHLESGVLSITPGNFLAE
jgi:hypothetical protein